MNLLQQTELAWKEAGTWNSGKFSESMNKIFADNGINVEKAQNRMEKAFMSYLAGSQNSWVYIEAAIKDIENNNYE